MLFWFEVVVDLLRLIGGGHLTTGGKTKGFSLSLQMPRFVSLRCSVGRF